jgi:hypothetical protein
VLVQMLALKFDATFTPELKEFSNKVIPALGVPYDYQYFPGVEHSFATRGDQQSEAQLRALTRAKNAVVFVSAMAAPGLKSGSELQTNVVHGMNRVAALNLRCRPDMEINVER